MAIQIKQWTIKSKCKTINKFLQRTSFQPEIEAVASKILCDVQERGEAAILEAAAKYDGAQLLSNELRVAPSEIKTASTLVSAATKSAIRDAHRRIRKFARAGMRKPWKMRTPKGGWTGEFFSPMKRIGIYIPGGTAPLASTVLMSVTLARVAGVREIVACTPCGADKTVNPAILYALNLAGATEVYRVGGVHSIGLMAFGTDQIKPVHKIAGPGNAYVTAAKRQVYGFTGIDQVAGPSEIAVLADKSANPAWVAADMLSQTEHGSGDEKALLVTDSQAMAEAVKEKLKQQVKNLSRAEMIQKVIAANGILLTVVPDLREGVELINRFAPEHLEIICAKPRSYLPQVRAAGAIFLGPWTPEPVGDFIAGPSHVLPTGGAARMFNGLSVDDFRLRHSFVEFTQADLQETLPSIETFAQIEGLDAHGNSASIRFQQD